MITLARTEFLTLVAFIGCGCASDPSPGAPAPDKPLKPYATWTSSADDLTSVEPYSNQTLRQIAHLSIGGERIRMKFSNLYGDSPLTLSKVRVAKSLGGSAIDTDTDIAVEFDHGESATIAPGEEIWSDDVLFEVASEDDVAVSVFVNDSADAVTVHRVAMRTNYVGSGDATSAAELTASVQEVSKTVWLTEIDAFRSEPTNVVVAFGDSITDGTGSSMGANRRYPDQLSKLALATNESKPQLSVVNEGISGNRWLHDGIGERGSERFKRDVLGVSGASHVVVLLGINDIGYSVSLAPDQAVTADELTSAMASAAQAVQGAGLHVLMATILPFQGADYYSDEGEAKRQAINAWIRANKDIDGVIDFDEALRDPAAPATILPAYDGGDHLHLGDAGYGAMAKTVDVSTLR